MAESTENCMKTGDCFALLAMTFETCDLLKLVNQVLTCCFDRLNNELLYLDKFHGATNG